jgi:DNA segregation ATPase FtsK/SpoIIIE, S-DNA-T family
MAFKHQKSPPQRLLPPSLEDRLVRTLTRGLGAALCLSSAFGWISLLSWSAADPSFLHVTGGAVRNWLGSPGAATADMLLQTLGVASLFVLLAPMTWGSELWLAERLPDARLKLMLFPLSVLLLAAGFSALPLWSQWPLHRGFGGMLGDLIYHGLDGALGAINPGRSGSVAGLLCFIGGVAALTHSIGLQGRDLLLLLRATPPAEFPDRRQSPRYVSWWGRWRTRRAARQADPPSLEGSGAEGRTDHDYRRTWSDPTAVGSPEPHELSAPATARQVPERPSVVRPTVSVAVPPAQPVLPETPAPAWHPTSPRPVLPQMVAISVPTVQPSAAAAAKPAVMRAPVAIPPTAPARAASRIAMSVDFASPHRAPFQAPFADGQYIGLERRTRARDPVFEKSTESGSRSIAARFAPSSSGSAIPTRTYTNKPAPNPARKPSLFNSLTFRRNSTTHQRPSLNLLMRATTTPAAPESGMAHLRAVSERLVHGLADFGVDARVVDTRAGPVVTEFVIKPASGTRLSRIRALADDIARTIGVPAVRILDQGEGADEAANVGIEVPNARAEAVLLRDVLDSDAYRTTTDALPLALGKTVNGAPVLIDLATLPHLLVTGDSNSGKSVGLNTIVLSLLFRHAPEDCRLLLIDTGRVDFGVYAAIPHLLTPVITEPARGIAALQWAAAEMSERYKRMALLGLQDIGIYNNRVRDAKRRGEVLSRTVQTGFDPRSGLPVFEESPLALDLMPTIVILVDEFEELMLLNRHATELAVHQLAASARNAGIHLIMATQRLTPDVLTPMLHGALPSRLTFRLNNKAESRLVLGETGAEHLLGHGDMLLRIAHAGSTHVTRLRVHGAMITPEEIESVAASVRAQGAPRYVEDLGDAAPPATPADQVN